MPIVVEGYRKNINCFIFLRTQAPKEKFRFCQPVRARRAGGRRREISEETSFLNLKILSDKKTKCEKQTPATLWTRRYLNVFFGCPANAEHCLHLNLCRRGVPAKLKFIINHIVLGKKSRSKNRAAPKDAKSKRHYFAHCLNNFFRSWQMRVF